MKTGPLTMFLVCPIQGRYVGLAILALLVGIGGCQKGISKDESVVFWPLFTSEKTFLTDQNGTKHSTDTGSACLIAHWDRSVEIDNMGNKILGKNFISIWPIFESYETEEPNSRHRKGTILLFFHYESTIDVSVISSE